jgi:gamma-glutamylcyclotransferase (GGCT)/AIG2-like uncharacterized protein YtfP
MNKDGHYAFYGTLRVGMENHLLFQRGMEFIDRVSLRGFELISLGDYPYAVKSDMANASIIAELFKVDPRIAKAIHDMELEAGYYYDEIEIGKNLYGIYLFSAVRPFDEVIPSGDWVHFVSARGF